ncbi:MAG TPA: phosphatidate cytidylyltransferase, partial [Thermoguttaceae bacterium]|nr:phosphatidate cytidylyltransferase [Thermoguttaceae bacterium]
QTIMLRWRLLLGTLIIGALIALCWLDHRAVMPGVWLLPVAVAAAVLASGEILYLAEAAGMRPLPWAVYGGNVLLVLSNWSPPICCRPNVFSEVGPMAGPLVALGLGVLAVFLGEMRRYKKPGGVVINLAASVFGLVYVGVLFSFLIQLRLMWGVGALASLIIVVKMGDTGAYTIGRLFGRHKMAPVLSPGKTLEGALGALAFGCLGAFAAFQWLIPAVGMVDGHVGLSWGWLPFGLLVGLTGLFGDLAESLIKRDAGCKDSSRWLPGFGGVLDILDSILLAAPVAWLCWALKLV